ncbi:BZ3501_MvSof-1269-A2-R1_Chr3-1g05648 [Microbotryum saponariae]|nr:BZ3501_MvSof-1269-A2-R1_Chr3-1g05648 [Microbotryum saponariae]
MNVPLGMDLFPAIKPLPQGDDLLKAFIWGDVQEQEAKREKEQKEMEEQFDERREKFGTYWRDQFVKEFGTGLGTLAEEPGLTQPRLKLLLDSINSLSALHTTSSEAAKASRSIWYHDPEETVDPLAGLPKAPQEEADEEWATEKVGGLGDVESALEGLEDALKKGKDVGVEGSKDEAMEVDQE